MNIEEKHNANLVDEVLKLVFEKTGIILLKNRHGSHEFIPTGLRSIVHLIHLLKNLKTVDLLKIENDKTILNQEIDSTVLKKNLDIFEDYLKGHSIIEGMTKEYYKILHGMLEINWENLNQHLVRTLVAQSIDSERKDIYYSQGFYSNPRFRSDDDGSLDMSGIALPENISIGDALFMLNKIRNAISIVEIERFIAIAKVIYSARLVRLAFVDNKTENTFKNLHQLLGGLIYNPQGTEIVRGGRDWRPVVNYASIKYNNDSIPKIDGTNFIQHL